MVSIHARTGRATLSYKILLSLSRFQSTHAQGVRLFYKEYHQQDGGFQSTHAQGVRHAPTLRYTYNIAVSIHARTGRATRNCNRLSSRIWFQSTHAQGVRRKVLNLQLSTSWFQSTHAQGVRLKDLNLYFSTSRFQSTHAQGVRRSYNNYHCFRVMFQSTHAQGVRPVGFFPNGGRVSFNPRTHRACDQKIFLI